MRRLADAVVLLALLVLCCVYICAQAMKVFDFFDMSAFIDAGYRVWRGQKIYVDFFYIAGPIHPYFFALAFKIFGFNKTAILAYLCAQQIVCLTTVFVIARRSLDIRLSAALTALTCLSLFGPIVHPWYDQTAIAFFLVACAAMLWSYPGGGKWRGWVLPAISGACIAGSFLSKTNVGASCGGMMLLGYIAISVALRSFRFVVVYVVAGLIVLAGVVLTTASPSAYLYQNFGAFDTGRRLGDLAKLLLILRIHPYFYMALAGAFILGMAGRRWCRAHLAEVSLFIITVVTAIFSAWTGSAIAESYCFFWGLITLWLCVLIAGLPRGMGSGESVGASGPGPVAEASTLPAGAIGTGQYSSVGALSESGAPALERRILMSMKWIAWASIIMMFLLIWPMQFMTWSWQEFNVNLIATYTMRNKPMEGWRCRADIGRGMDQSIDYINKHVPISDSLFVAPDCQIVYGLTGHDSYRKVPFGFNTDNSPGTGWMRSEMLDHFHESPPLWILLRNEKRQNPLVTGLLFGNLGLIGTIESDYRPVAEAHFDGFQLYRRR